MDCNYDVEWGNNVQCILFVTYLVKTVYCRQHMAVTVLFIYTTCILQANVGL